MDKVFQLLATLLSAGWIVSDYLIDGISKWDILGYSIGTCLLVGFLIWDRRSRSDIAGQPDAAKTDA